MNISEIELERLKEVSAKYEKVLARSANYKKENKEYTVKYNREYHARRMLEPEFRKQHNESIAKSAKKRRELNKLENPPPVRPKTKKHIFDSDIITESV